MFNLVLLVILWLNAYHQSPDLDSSSSLNAFMPIYMGEDRRVINQDFYWDGMCHYSIWRGTTKSWMSEECLLLFDKGKHITREALYNSKYIIDKDKLAIEVESPEITSIEITEDLIISREYVTQKRIHHAKEYKHVVIDNRKTPLDVIMGHEKNMTTPEVLDKNGEYFDSYRLPTPKELVGWVWIRVKPWAMMVKYYREFEMVGR